MRILLFYLGLLDIPSIGDDRRNSSDLPSVIPHVLPNDTDEDGELVKVMEDVSTRGRRASGGCERRDNLPRDRQP